MEEINNRNIKLVEFDISTNWAINLPTNNWLAIILTKSKNKNYFDEIIRKSIDRNVGYICSIGEQQELVHDMADEEIVFRDVTGDKNYIQQTSDLIEKFGSGYISTDE